MKKTVYAVAFLVLLTSVAAQNPLDQESASLDMTLSNQINIQPRTANYDIDFIEARLSWIPRDSYRQTVSTVTTEPRSESIGDEFLFRWENPREKELNIQVSSSINTESKYFPIREKVEFPINNLPSKYSKYLREQGKININDDIQEKAAELAEGKDDLYEVTFAIMTWVNQNINYSLDSLTAEASQKSSWVLKNRRGVCDELTSLSISMLRSLGIPARFVYGQSYTNIGVYDDNWGGHGWAEVYFPGQGWVPFDPTYAEYGYLDSGHVKMGSSLDADRPSLKYSLQGRNVDVTSSYLDIDSDVVNLGDKATAGVSISSKPHYKEVGFGSYNLIQIDIDNSENIYKPLTLELSHPPEISVEEETKSVLLEPGGEKSVYWLVEVPNNLEGRYVYTFPFKVRSQKGIEEEVVFESNNDGKVYSGEVFKEIVNDDSSQKPYSNQVSLNCESSKEVIYLDEEATISCTVKNTGLKDLDSLQLCNEESCESKDLKSSEELSYEVVKSFENPGVKNVIVKAEHPLISKTGYTRVNVLDEAKVSIKAKAPKRTKYGEDINVVFNVSKKSTSTPENVDIKLDFQGSSQEWHVDSLEKIQKYNISVSTNGFTFKNKFKITVSYEDEAGKTYREEKELAVELSDLSIKDYILASMNWIGYKIISILT